MDAIRVVTVPEFAERARQVHGVPEEHLVTVLTPDSSDQPFAERMRDRSVWNRFDFLDLKDSQVGEPAVKSKQWVVVRTNVLGQALVRAGAIEHPAYRNPIDATGFDAETDNTAAEGIHDQHRPMAGRRIDSQRKRSMFQRLSLAWAIDYQPGGTRGAEVAGSIVPGEDSTNHVLVDVDAET